MNKKPIDSKNMDNAKDSEWPAKDLLIVITDAESALIEPSRQDAEDAGKHIHDNRWNWNWN